MFCLRNCLLRVEKYLCNPTAKPQVARSREKLFFFVPYFMSVHKFGGLVFELYITELQIKRENFISNIC